MNLETITIVSTENGGSNDFVTKPIATHVKSRLGWPKNQAPDPYYEKCNISFAGNTFSGQVKVRGNWTTSYAKKSLRIKFDKKQTVLGLHGGEKYKNWVLLACVKDASFLRDAAAFTMFKTMFPGYYASDFRLVNVVINNKNFGIYLLAEQQEAKRLELTEPEDNATNTDIGYLLEFDNYYSNEADNEQFEIDYIGPITNYYNEEAASDLNKGYTIKSDVYGPEQHDFIEDYMNNLWKICYNAAYNGIYYEFDSSYDLQTFEPAGSTPDEKAKNCVAKVIDLTSLANTYIFSEITCDPDLYYSSFYLNIDFAEGKDHLLRFEAPWDFDSTMGNKRFCGNCTDNFAGCEEGSMYAGKGQPDVNGSLSGEKKYVNPWMVIFIRSAWFQELVKAQWGKVDKNFLKSNISAVINNYTTSEEYINAFNTTLNKWDNEAAGELNNSTNAKKDSQSDSADYLKDWLIKRIDYVDSIIKNLQPNYQE